MLNALRRRFQAWWSLRHTPSDTHLMVQRNIYILPSRPGLFFCATLLLLLLASINEQLSLGYLLTFLLTGAGLASMHVTHGNLRGLSLDLRAPAPAFVGEETTLEIRLHNRAAARHGIGLRAADQGRDHLAWTDVPAQGHSQLQLRLTMPRRGLHALPALRIETRFPFGLFGAWSVWRPASQVWVYPAPEQPCPPLPVASGSADPQQTLQLAPLPGQDLDEVRAYRRGDSPRQILWKKAAQAGDEQQQLWVRDTRSPRGRDLWLDMVDAAGRDAEARLSRLCAWVLKADAQGLPYGLRLGSRELGPALGAAHRQACLELLAQAEGAPS